MRPFLLASAVLSTLAASLAFLVGADATFYVSAVAAVAALFGVVAADYVDALRAVWDTERGEGLATAAERSAHPAAIHAVARDRHGETR